jgi:hypothetical protein
MSSPIELTKKMLWKKNLQMQILNSKQKKVTNDHNFENNA